MLFQGNFVPDDAGEVQLREVAPSGYFKNRFGERAVIDIQAEKTNALAIGNPVLVDFGRRRKNEIAGSGEMSCAATFEISGASGVGAEMKFVVPVSRIRMREVSAAMEYQPVKPRVLPDLEKREGQCFFGGGAGARHVEV